MRFDLRIPSIILSCLVLAALPAHADSDFSDFPHWRYVLEHEHVKAAPPFAGDLKPILDRLHAKYHRVPYQTDIALYGERNHWATRRETRQHGAADCKGIAVAELYDLLDLGVPDQRVEIIVATVRATDELHAVTRADGWILDILAARVLTLEEFQTYYSPIFAINRLGWHRETQLAGGIPQ
jgi:predicted transglutaminase-like cysteine proteinase